MNKINQLYYKIQLAMEHKLDKLGAGPNPDVKQILSIKQIYDGIAENQQFTEKVERVVKTFI